MTKKTKYYRQNDKKQNSQTAINLKIFNFGLFFLVTTFAFFYLIGISDLTTKGFVLQELRTEASSLEERKVSFEDKVNDLQSYYFLNEKVEILDMVAINDIEYIKVGSQVVAKK